MCRPIRRLYPSACIDTERGTDFMLVHAAPAAAAPAAAAGELSVETRVHA
jgi:hypothetical protein